MRPVRTLVLALVAAALLPATPAAAQERVYDCAQGFWSLNPYRGGIDILAGPCTRSASGTEPAYITLRSGVPSPPETFLCPTAGYVNGTVVASQCAHVPPA
ncbi:hypothetical protein ACNF49_39880 [Actinomadura sp. ATCC 39365]|uniref:hypothetical protein n=1 Tax=Nonomuraea sp. NPDC005692 TaxID=3157168 RepID=UPI0033D49AFC